MSSNDTAATSAPSKFSLSLGGKKTSSPHTSKPHQKRPHNSSALSFGAGEEDYADSKGAHERISTFGQGIDDGSAKSAPKPEVQRIIPSIPDRDWQAESRRKRQKHTPAAEDTNAQVNGSSANANNADIDTVGSSVPRYGLNVVDRSAQQPSEQDDAESKAIGEDTTTTPPRTQTADEEALDALLGKRQQQQTTIAPSSPPPSEDQVFRNSYAAAPRNCTLEEYEATPVEGYGAAILRGYLKQGQTLESQEAQRVGGKGSKEKPSWIPERRPGLLGLGAKESGLGVELGAWGKGAGRGRGSKMDEAAYNPLARRNKKTGEMLTEEELKRKVEEHGRVVVDDRQGSRDGSRRPHESSSKRDSRRHEDDDEESDRRHRRREEGRDRERDRERDKDKGRHRDDDRERDRRRHDKHRDNRDIDSERKSRHTSDRTRDETDSDRHRRRDRSRERRKDRDYHSSSRRD